MAKIFVRWFSAWDKKGRCSFFRAGYTLVEVLFVLAVLAILAAVVIPRLTKTGLYGKYTVYLTAHKVAADLRLARRLAVTTGDDHKLECSKTGGSSDYNAYALYRQSGSGWDKVSETKSIADEISSSGDGSCTFEPTGAASNSRTFNYEIDVVKYRAVVTRATGHVKLEAY